MILKRQFNFAPPQIQVPQVQAPSLPSVPQINAPQVPAPGQIINDIGSGVKTEAVSIIKSILGPLLNPAFWMTLGGIVLLVLVLYCCFCTPFGSICYQCAGCSVRNMRTLFRKLFAKKEKESITRNSLENKEIES